MPPVKLVNPKTGEELTATDENQAGLIRSLGYRDVTGEEAAAASSAQAEKDYYSGGWQQVQAGVEGVMRGASFGLLDDGSTDSELRKAYNPKTAMVSELGGALAPALLSGGESLVGTAASATPVGALSRGAAFAGEALADSKMARGAIQGVIEGGGQVAGTAIVDALHNKPETAEHLVANLGLGLVLGGGLGAIGGAIGGKLEAAGDKAAAKLAAQAEEETLQSSRRLADDFLQRGDVQIRLQKVDGAVEAAKQDLAQAQARTTQLIENEVKLNENFNKIRQTQHEERYAADLAAHEEMVAKERAAFEAQVAKDLEDHARLTKEDLVNYQKATKGTKLTKEQAVDKAAIPYHRELKAFGDSLLDDVALDPQLAKKYAGEISALKAEYKATSEVIEEAKGTPVGASNRERGPGFGSYDEITTRLDEYRKSLFKLARKMGRESELPGTLEEAAASYIPKENGRYYVKGTPEPIPKPAPRELPKRTPPPVREAPKPREAPAPREVNQQYIRQAMDIEKTKEALDSFKTVKLSKASPEEFLDNAKKMEALLSSQHVSKATKEALTDALDDVAKNGFGFGTNAAALKGLDVGEMAKALGLSDDVAFAAASVPEIAKPYAAGWVAFQSLEQTPAKLAKMVKEAKEGRGLFSRLIMGAAAGKAATAATAVTGSRAAGYAVFHTVVQGGLHAIEGAGRAVQQKIVEALAKWGNSIGSKIRNVTPTVAGRLTASELSPVPKTAKQTYASHYKEVLQQWKEAAGPNGANRLYANLEPLRQVSPNLANNVAVQAQRVAAQVVAKAPQDPGNVYFGMRSSWQPDELSLHKWLDYASIAIGGPQHAAEAFAKGELTAEGAQALRECWPETFNTIRTLVAAKLNEVQDHLSYNDFIKVSNLLDLPATGTMHPDFIQAQQEMFIEQAQENVQQGKSPMAGPLPNSSSPQTKNQQISQH